MTNEHKWTYWLAQYVELEEQTLQIDAVEVWLRKWSDLEKQVYEQEAKLHRLHFANTADTIIRQQYDDFLKNAMPEFEKVRARLIRKLVEHLGPNLPTSWQIFVTGFREDLALHREENLPLLAEDAVQSKNFSTIVNEVRVAVAGSYLSLNELQSRQLVLNRSEREEAYRLAVAAELKIEEQLAELFLSLLRLRQRIAANAGCTNFHEFAWRRLHRVAYTPKDVHTFRATVQDEVVPLLRELREERRRLLDLDVLRPWDVQVSPFPGTLKPQFTNGVDLAKRAAAALQRVDPEIATCFMRLVERGDADLEVRENKSARSFTNYKTAAHEAILFIHGAQRPRTIHTLMHEVGHAFHFESITRDELYWNLWPPKEFKEFVAQSLEVLTIPHLSEPEVGFYASADMPAVIFLFFERVLLSIVHAARMDEFQEWVYTSRPEHVTSKTMNAFMLTLFEKYGVGVDYSGFESYYATRWQTQNVFLSPLYQIEYAFAWIGSLTLWEHIDANPEGTLSRYKNALKLGNSVDVHELYSCTGVTFNFSQIKMKQTISFMREQLRQLMSGSLNFPLREGEQT